MKNLFLKRRKKQKQPDPQGNSRISDLLNLFKSSRRYEPLRAFFSKYWLICFFIGLIIYFELLYRLWIFKGLSIDFLFPVLFALPAGALLYIIICLLPVKAEGPAALILVFLLSLLYGIQLVYTCIFHTPLSLISLGGAGDALQFQDIIIEAILKNALAVVLLFLPLVLFILQYKKLKFFAIKPLSLGYAALFCVSAYSAAIISVGLTGDSPASQNSLYYKVSSPELSVNKLGVFTTVRLDFGRLLGGKLENQLAGRTEAKSGGNVSAGTKEPSEEKDGPGGSAPAGTGALNEATGTQPDAGAVQGEETPVIPQKPFNAMDIDFDALLAKGQGDSLYPMHKYFSTIQPTATNQYTGMFKGCNLILLTAEGFSPYVISPELTPTLYEMSTTGFVFENFYNPIWWVSTSDGEYVACTGLIPKSGVWSMAHSGKNYMPFAMGNQLRKLGYTTKAYHNHTYTYYKRDISHPNLGYDYKGVGNGLNITKTWPESDLEMINATVDEYIGQQPFHAYYMTVSGHMNYTFGGNQMARKNREYVKDLPYSDASKAYIACNLELEFALRSLVEKLEAAGIAENTVIALSADHYPYGLAKENIDELAGHEVEKNFELYESTFILWKKGMEPVIVEEPCESLDILPTLSNLFGLEYDSRLLMGRDILSDAPTLVIFSNRSWITDRAIYNSAADTVKFTDGTEYDKEYVQKVNRAVADKFKYSAKILETDYYRKVLN